jgi:hypothetical protein
LHYLAGVFYRWIRDKASTTRRIRNLVRTGTAITLAVLLIGACALMHNATRTLTGDLPIAAPSSAFAGEAIFVTVGPVAASNGTPIGLVMIGAYGPRVYNTVFESGIASFIIPAEDTRQPGYLALIVAADDARGEASIRLFWEGASSASPSAKEAESVAASSV